MSLSQKELEFLSGTDFALIAQYFIDELSIVLSERMWTGQQILGVL